MLRKGLELAATKFNGSSLESLLVIEKLRFYFVLFFFNRLTPGGKKLII